MSTPQRKALGAAPALFIAFLNWCRIIFILNRFRGFNRFTKAEMLALLLYLFGGFAAWIAEMCILNDSLTALQVIASLFRTSLNWFGMLLVVNERLFVTRQQVGSYVFIMGIAFLWEVQHRIVLN